MPGTKEITRSVDDLLREACARNATFQLHYEGGDGSIVIADTQFRDIRDDRILADKLIYRDDDERIPEKRPATAHFSVGGERVQFVTALEAVGVPIPSIDHGRSLGVALRRPGQISPSQRRAHVRVSLDSSRQVTLWAAPACTKTPNACALDKPHLSGRLLNLSAGGATILVDNGQGRPPKQRDRYYLSFDLPDCGDEFCLFGSVRHTRAVSASESHRISFAFKPWDGSHLAKDQQRIIRFIVAQERDQLRRR